MSTTTNRANLKFYSSTGEIVRLSIPRACMDKTAEAARDGMEAILANGAVVVGGKLPQTVRSAELQQTHRRVLV